MCRVRARGRAVGAAVSALTPDSVPAELRDRPQWVARRGKVLVDPKTGRNAKTNDPSTWGTFEEAVARAKRDGLDGIGFVFAASDPYAFVDVDRCFDPETGEADPWALEVVRNLESYTELSTSGEGLHVVVRGEKPGPRCRAVADGHRIEMYDAGQYLALTGRLLPGRPPTVEDRAGALGALYHEMFGDAAGDIGELTDPVSPPMGDDEILERCRRAGNAEKFAVLWSGDTSGHGGDHSAADQSLVSVLSFYTQDKDQLDRLFRRSGLMRPKWERPDYRERTVRKALTEDRNYFGIERDYPTVTFIDDLNGGEGGGATSATVPLHPGGDPAPTSGVPPFPLDVFPPSLRRFVSEAAHATEVPPDFVALPLIAALGTAIGASREAKISRNHREPPIFNTAVVAPPASGKSPAERMALLPVIHQQRLHNREHERALEEHKEKHQDWELAAAEARKKKRHIPPEPEKPVKKRIRVGDLTLEALMLRLVQNPRGLILTRDELAGFFKAMNQYRQGADREVWLSLHSGQAPPIDRKTADESHDIDHPCVSVIGGIQPGKLKVLDVEAGDGMVERFLFAYPAATLLPDAEEDVSIEAENGYRRIWDRLHALQMGEDEFGKPAPLSVPLAPSARSTWKRYKRRLKEEAYRPGQPEFVQGVLGKMVAYLARFALILALVRAVEEDAPEEIGPADLDRAWDLVGYFVAHAGKVYAELRGKSRQGELAGALGDLLAEVGGEWEGSAGELFEALKDMGHGEALPKVPDSLTEKVLEAARKTPALLAERKRSGGKRRLRLAWSSGAEEAAGVVAQRHSGAAERRGENSEEGAA